MKNNKTRVLAYSKSVVIDKSALGNVSGGRGFCYKPTTRASGSTGNADVFVDVIIDF